MRYRDMRHETRNKRMSGFTLMELLLVIVLLGFLIIAGLANFVSSLKKGRDSKRKNDLRQIAVALETYYNDFGKYPLSDANGEIKGCGANAAVACPWAPNTEWNNTTTGTIYMLTLPTDPSPAQNYYYSSSDGTYFQLYALLENAQDTGTGIKQTGYTGTNCLASSSTKCTYGVASTNKTP